MLAARCWSIRGKRSARSSSSCFVSSTTPPWPSSVSATGPGASSGSSRWSRPSISWRALTSTGASRGLPAIPGRVAMICGLVILALAIVRILAAQTWNAEVVPVAIAGMIVAIAYNQSFAMMITFGLSILTSIALGTEMPHFLVLMGGTAAAVLTLGEVRTRTKLIKVGATAALTYFLMTWATGLWQDQPLDLVRSDSFWRAGWGLMAGFFLGGSLPFIENALGIVTGISLLELGDNTHPLLQELVRRAPGTHNHSITVGAIAESAAERIGADALLVRIGAYFHDIGKMLKPHYFVENQVGPTSRHAKLAPAMSTLIIIGHVKDGVDLGRQHHLARADHRLDRAAPRHDPGRVFLPRGEPAQRCHPRRLAGLGKRLPLSGPQAADQGGGHPDDRRRRRERQPKPLGPHSVTPRGAGPRTERQAPARRSVRRVRAHPARNRRDPRQPDQVADRNLPRSSQVPRTPDGMRRARDLTRPAHPGPRSLDRDHTRTPSARPPSEYRSCSLRSKSKSATHKAICRWTPASLDQLVRIVLAAQDRPRASISIALVDNATIHAINRAHLGHDWPTDVITFPLADPDEPVLAGELVVSAEMACITAREFGVEPALTNSPFMSFMDCCISAASTTTMMPLDERMRQREDELLSQAGMTNPYARNGRLQAEPGLRQAEPETTPRNLAEPTDRSAGPRLAARDLEGRPWTA